MAAAANHQPPFMSSRNMHNQFEEVDFPLYPEQPMFSQDLYSNNIHSFNMDPNMVAFGNFPRSAQDAYPNQSTDFTPAQLYNEAPGFSKDSPHMYPIGSPELRAPLASNLSSASGPSASSSTIGSPYSGHGQVAPAIPEWGVQGLGLAPSIAGDYGYSNEYSFGSSGMEQDFAFADLNKPIGFVGECASVSASASNLYPSISSPTSSLSAFVPSLENRVDSALERSNSHGSTPRLAHSPLHVMSPPTVGRRDHNFSSPVTATPNSPFSTRRSSVQSFGGSYCTPPSSASGARPSPKFSAAPSLESQASEPVSPLSYRPTSFFSQSSGHFVPPLESSCLFPLSLHCATSHLSAAILCNIH
jgi:hypothetical protein